MDDQPQVRLVFAGDLLDGFSPDDVKRRFAQAFQIDEDRVAAMFSGGRTVLKRTMGRDDADRYVQKLRKLGMRVLVEPLGEAVGLKPLAAAAAAATPATAAAAPAKPASLTTAAPLVPAEEEIVCPNCGERQSKRILCRNCATDMPRGIAAKLEDQERARAERLAARQGGRYAPPRAEVGASSDDFDEDAPPFWGLRFSGRMGRINYLLSGMAVMLLMGVLGIVAAVLIPLTRSVLLALVFVPLLIMLLVFALRSVVLRLHDVNRSGWWAILMFLPFLPTFTASNPPTGSTITVLLILSVVNFLLGVVLLIYPGTDGDNDFGGRARPGNGLLAAIGVVIFVLAMAVYVNVAMKQYNEYVGRAQARQGIPASSDDDDDEDAAPGPAAAPSPQQAQRAAQRISSDAGREAFLREYLPSPNHKAFAAADSGAWGWSSGKSTPREAASSALAACEQHRQPYTGPCMLVNYNGGWVEGRR
jgi:uncharacterized membrane protein YhaH (DUF805 family)